MTWYTVRPLSNSGVESAHPTRQPAPIVEGEHVAHAFVIKYRQNEQAVRTSAGDVRVRGKRGTTEKQSAKALQTRKSVTGRLMQEGVDRTPPAIAVLTHPHQLYIYILCTKGSFAGAILGSAHACNYRGCITGNPRPKMRRY